MSGTFAAEGGCLCGAVRFRLTAPPDQVGYCHCRSCRKHTGAPVSAFADCRREKLEWIRGAPTLYPSSPGVRRGFCARCGSTLTYQGDNLPDAIHIHVGALDRPEDFAPTAEASFPDERLAWFHLAAHA